MIDRVEGQLVCDTTEFYSIFKQLFDKCNNITEIDWLNIHIEPMIKSAKIDRLVELEKSLKG